MEPGDLVGGCRIVRVLGRGAMATVYEAIQIRLRRRIALKVLHSEFGHDPRVVRRFLREAEAAGSLQHPGIAVVHDRGQEGTRPYIVMELVDGPTLDEVLKRLRGERPAADGDAIARTGRFGPETSLEDRIELAVEVGVQVARALQTAHDRGIVHRDVKPSNILLADGQAKLTDFGLAGVQHDAGLTAPQERIGTPAYMSPEQALGRAADARSDVYSLGATLYEILTLRRSVEGHSLQDYIHRIPVEDPPPARKLVPGIPRDLEVVLQTAMRKEPERRYPTAGALAEDLERFRRGEAIAARPEGTLRRISRAGRRHPVARLGVLALLLALLGALAVWRLWPEDPTLAHLTLEPLGGGSHTVHAIPLDELGSPRFDEAFELEQRSDEVLQLQPGSYRLVVGGREAFAEISVELAAGERSTVGNFRILPTVDVQEGMRRVAAGEYTLPHVSATLPKGIRHVRGLWMDRHEVTHGQFARFLEESGDPEHLASGFRVSPAPRSAVRVPYAWAEAYARWVGKRIPDADEWLAAYVGPDNHPPTGGNVATGRPGEVMSSEEDRTPLGIYDMRGGLSEWTATWSLQTSNGRLKARPSERIVLGHNYDRLGGLDGSLAQNVSPDETVGTVGFRCVKGAWPFR